jgi:hypothetical protein
MTVLRYVPYQILNKPWSLGLNLTGHVLADEEIGLIRSAHCEKDNPIG